jgi:AcrR family transcriptional regulator
VSAQAAGTRAPGRPRSAEADLAIVRATLQVLGEDGYRGLSVEKVRAVAGVGKATIYRRYPSREALVKAAVSHLQGTLEVPEDQGSLRADFAALAHVVASTARQTGGTGFMARMLSEAGQEPDVHEIFMATLVDPRRAAVRTLVERAVARGEVRADVDPDLAIDLIVGPMIYRTLLGGIAAEALEQRALAVFDTVFEGLRAR